MPELPEVETIKRDLSKLIVGRKILSISTDSPKQIKPSLEMVKKSVVGASINKIERRAKLLQFFLSNGEILVVHLKLTGRLLVREKGTPQDNWQHICFSLSGGKELRFADLRKFGWLKLLKDKAELEKLLAEFGPEPLDELGLKEFQTILASSSRSIKIVLMDQKKIAGVGNIYASDALFLAKIHPGRAANQLKAKEAQRLFEAIKKVLRAGIKYRGASDQYYLDALGHKGLYQEHFLVYNRAGKKCLEGHEKIEKIRLGGRGTYFCPVCQRL
ncbi:MAG: bifunctional DNA-formamidopyrimidine glycosylase/DNA-(apurinic or apyrimidinic site) lyase [Patescibacteria group bacterium]